MLAETMGADGAFDRRRLELSLLQGVSPEGISNEEVVESFVKSVTPGAGDQVCTLRFCATILAVQSQSHTRRFWQILRDL